MLTRERDLFIRLWCAPPGTPLLHIGRGSAGAIATLYDDIWGLAVDGLESTLYDYPVGEFPPHLVDETVLGWGPQETWSPITFDPGLALEWAEEYEDSRCQ